MATPFSRVYDSFFSKITDDMYMELTEQDTFEMLYQLLISAIQKFEFPRKNLEFTQQVETTITYDPTTHAQIGSEHHTTNASFTQSLSLEEINILAVYMIVEWLSQQLASVENTRMKYSGSDFKFTSQASHMQKILALKKDYEREGFHLQRLYKRRKKDSDGIMRSTFGSIMGYDD